MSSDNLLVSSADFTELETALDRGAIGTVGRMVPRTSDIALSGLSRRLHVERFTSSAQMLDMINASRDEDFGDTGMRGRRGLGAA